MEKLKDARQIIEDIHDLYLDMIDKTKDALDD